MNLDKDCARDVLLYVKDFCTYQETNHKKDWHEVSFNELCKSERCGKYGLETISYTIKMLVSYNFITLGKFKCKSDIDRNFENVHIDSLTASGHEFIDNLTDNETWEKVKSLIKDSSIKECSLSIHKIIYDEIMHES